MNAVERKVPAATGNNSKRYTVITNSIQQVQSSTLDITRQEKIVDFSNIDYWHDEKTGKRIVGSNGGKIIYENTLIGDSITGNLERHGIREFEDGSLEPMADDDTDEWQVQYAKICIINGQPVEHVNAQLARIRKEMAEERAYEAAEKRRKIISHRSKEDLSALKKMLPQYLKARGIAYEPRSKTWRCVNHQDEHPSAHGYFNQEKPVLYCGVCSKSFDIFNIESLLTGETRFPELVKSVKRILGVY
jgi:hypothetical protein